MGVVADELRRTAEAIVFYATDIHFSSPFLPNPAKNAKRPPKIAAYANDLLLLIADKQFCRAIVQSSPGTAGDVAAREHQDYGRRIRSDHRAERSRRRELAHISGARRLEDAGEKFGPEGEKSQRSEPLAKFPAAASASVARLISLDLGGKKSLRQR